MRVKTDLRCCLQLVLVLGIVFFTAAISVEISAQEQASEKKPLIPYQDFTEQDIKTFPPKLLKEIKEKEQEWGDFLLKQRSLYNDYYKDTLGEGVHCTLDIYKAEQKLMATPGYRDTKPPVIEKKSFTRFPDQIWISSSYFPELVSKKIDNMRLICHRFGKFHLMPFNIDEGTPDGEKVLPLGPSGNPSKGNERFDNSDQLTFQAHDCGDRIELDAMKKNYGSDVVPVEIELSDPKTGGKGWLYLVFFPANPPAKLGFDYVNYHNDTVNQQYSNYIFHQSTFLFEKNKIYRKVFCRAWKYAPFFKTTGEDLVDRMKVRINARLCFGLINIGFTEDDASGDWLAWLDGQALATGRGWISIKLPLGLKSPRLIFDVIATETVMSVPMDVHVPFNPGYVLTDYTMKIGTDWFDAGYLTNDNKEDDKMFRFFNSNNLEGVVVDGKMSEREKNWNPKKDEWRILSGPPGSIAFRSFWDPYYAKQADIRVSYIDDFNANDPPEFHRGQLAMHYSISRVMNLEPRLYKILLEWYGPPEFWDPDPSKYNWKLFYQYIDILNYPVEVKTANRQGKNLKPDLRFPKAGT